MQKDSRIIYKQDIEKAIAATRSNKAAARYLDLSYNTYKKYAKMYIDEAGVSLFDKHMNQSGKDIPKFFPKSKNNRNNVSLLIEILHQKNESYSLKPGILKSLIIHEKILDEKCNRCGYCERREIDYKVPLILNYRDKNKRNVHLNNIELLCYNCYFLEVGDVFNEKQLKALETVYTGKGIDLKAEFELSEDRYQKVKESGLLRGIDSIDPEIKPQDFPDASEFIEETKPDRKHIDLSGEDLISRY